MRRFLHNLLAAITKPGEGRGVEEERISYHSLEYAGEGGKALSDLLGL